MSFTKATFDTHAAVQKIIPLPYFADKFTYKLVPNLPYNKVYLRIFRTSLLLVYSTYLIFDTIYLCYILTNWNSPLTNYLDRIVVYAMISCLDTLNIATAIAISTQNDNIQYLITQFCQLVLFETSTGISWFQKGSFNFKLRTLTFEEICFYCMVGILPFSSICMFFAPFLFSFLPLQLLLGNSVLVRAASSFINGVQIVYMFWYLLSGLQIAISTLELVKFYTSELTVGPEIFEYTSQKSFMKFYRKYRKTQILTNILNQAFAYIAMVWIYVGVACGSVCTYATLTMRDSIPILIYLVFPVTSIHIYIFAISFSKYSDMFSGNVTKFLQFWKRFCSRRQERRILRSCVQLGFQAGTYGTIIATTGLHISDDIIDNTVTLLLCFKMPQ